MSRRGSFSYDSMVEDTKIFNKTAQTAISLQEQMGRDRRFEYNVQSPASISTTSTAFLAEKFLKRVGAKVTRALSIVPIRSSSRRDTRALSIVSIRSSSRSDVSSSSLARSRSLALDSQRAEAVEDCIEFLNSSSCLHK